MHVPSGEDEGGGGGSGSSGVRDGRRMALDAAAGAAAGCISRVIVAPLDLVKIRLQVQLEPVLGGSGISKYTGFTHAIATVLREEGVTGLWRGTVPGLLLTVPYTAVQFVALQQVKDTAARLGWTARDSPWAPAVSFGSGAVAGAAATVASYPFDLLRTTLAAQGEPKGAPARHQPPAPVDPLFRTACVQVYRTMGAAARGIVKDHGVIGLYRGLGVTLIEIVPYAALQFGLYDALNTAWKNARVKAAQQSGQGASSKGSSGGGAAPPPDKVQAFTCGLLAGLVAKLTSHPLDVAKKRYQVAGLPRSLRYGARVERTLAIQPLFSCLAEIYQREGVAGLWKGSVPSIVKAAPAAALTFLAYEQIIAWMIASGWAGDGGTGQQQAQVSAQEQGQKQRQKQR
ncbi:thiamine pyrophosphate carrier [Monoraphidium neglectum]|uniref:Thiamine pyrophosphate carrier n=1 Tax=Monoraphidium neglectum TaxID=145388 RepID=A0A0D2MQT5_9CHLO|nr:thiamine pyrophosphate carrier [Monoraphidium neglectum]KIZ04995.1 thiamine pyrophosphate carrier [Monoraphidium neglectum]|eukprot:XP_013904014.1 thiamine pyrophosphate carrier [Monoraphidium neglectum]